MDASARAILRWYQGWTKLALAFGDALDRRGIHVEAEPPPHHLHKTGTRSGAFVAVTQREPDVGMIDRPAILPLDEHELVENVRNRSATRSTGVACRYAASLWLP